MKKMMKISTKLLDVFRKHDSFLITGHINPEGDSIGSSLALALGLKKLGKRDVVVISSDPVPEILRFLPSSGTIRKRPPRRRFDVVCLVDCNSPDRTGFDSFNAEKSVVIDHHILPREKMNAPFYRSAAAMLIDHESAAAGVLVYKVLTAMKIPIDRNIATCLYTALLVDTGGFRYSNTDGDALRIAAELVDAGASPWSISREIHESIPYRSMKLLGVSLSTIGMDGRISWMKTTRSMLKKTGTTAEDTEDFVDFPRKVKDVEVAVFFREDGRGRYKISLRSKGKANVQKVAESFGGGGHAAAAGCKVKGSYEEVRMKVFRAVRKALRES
jgi:phosphoesterase RecJ-like protein